MPVCLFSSAVNGSLERRILTVRAENERIGCSHRDPDRPAAPLPGKVNAEQALHFAESLAKGNQDAMDIIKDAFRDKAREMI